MPKIKLIAPVLGCCHEADDSLEGGAGVVGNSESVGGCVDLKKSSE